MHAFMHPCHVNASIITVKSIDNKFAEVIAWARAWLNDLPSSSSSSSPSSSSSSCASTALTSTVSWLRQLSQIPRWTTPWSDHYYLRVYTVSGPVWWLRRVLIAHFQRTILGTPHTYPYPYPYTCVSTTAASRPAGLPSPPNRGVTRVSISICVATDTICIA